MSVAESTPADALRKRVEALLAASPGAMQSADLNCINELAQALAIHQAELERQREELRATQLALQDARNQFAALYEHAPVGYVILDASGIIRQTNATWRAMLGCEKDDFRGRLFTDAITGDDVPFFRARWGAFLRDPAEKPIVLRMQRKKWRPVLCEDRGQIVSLALRGQGCWRCALLGVGGHHQRYL